MILHSYKMLFQSNLTGLVAVNASFKMLPRQSFLQHVNLFQVFLIVVLEILFYSLECFIVRKLIRKWFNNNL